MQQQHNNKKHLALLLLISCLFIIASQQVNAALKGGKHFDRILVVNFENTYIETTLKQPYFDKILANGTLLTNYHAVTHPSQPNYIAQIAGSPLTVKDDKIHDLSYTSVADLLEQNGYTWRSYQENYPGDCFSNAVYDGLYCRKHNPFMSFNNIRENKTRCSFIVNSDQLETDLRNDRLPNLMYYTPNLENDGHNTGVKYADKWLANFLPHYINNPVFMRNTLIVLTFDEDDSKHDNRVYTLLIGSMVPAGKTDDTSYSHYSLLRTIENNFGIGTLGREDSKAIPFKCLA